MSDSIPHIEYPRPQFVRNSYISLNGKWQLAITKNEEIPTLYDYDITVPFSPETVLSGVNHKLMPDEFLHYKKSFTISKIRCSDHVILHFGAVDQIAKVYVNKKLCTEHIGGFHPFEADITDFLSDGENELCVTVRDLTDTSYFSTGKQCLERRTIWYDAQSGIWQSVWLECVPENSLLAVSITPDFDCASISFNASWRGKKCDCAVNIYDDNNLIADGTLDDKIKIEQFKAWSPENPHIYNIEFVTEYETIKSYTALRKFSIGKDKNGIPRLFLNNAPYFFKGVLDQGYYSDGLLTPSSFDVQMNELNLIKEMGFNTVRKHIKIEPLTWYAYCDRIGLVVWQDMINGGERPYNKVHHYENPDDSDYKLFGRNNPLSREMYRNELKETVELLYNCPCIAMWVPFNESWGQFDSDKAYTLIRELDGTRYIDRASGWFDMGHNSFISKHIYAQNIHVQADSIKPYILSEFGGISCARRQNDDFSYISTESASEFNILYEKLICEQIIPNIKNGLSATIYTQLSDVQQERNGLISFDRKTVKADTELFARLNKFTSL